MKHTNKQRYRTWYMSRNNFRSYTGVFLGLFGLILWGNTVETLSWGLLIATGAWSIFMYQTVCQDMYITKLDLLGINFTDVWGATQGVVGDMSMTQVADVRHALDTQPGGVRKCSVLRGTSDGVLLDVDFSNPGDTGEHWVRLLPSELVAMHARYLDWISSGRPISAKCRNVIVQIGNSECVLRITNGEVAHGHTRHSAMKEEVWPYLGRRGDERFFNPYGKCLPSVRDDNTLVIPATIIRDVMDFEKEIPWTDHSLTEKDISKLKV